MPKARNRGRPTKFSTELADEICERLSGGEPYVKICKDDHMPDFSTVWRWERDHPEFKAQSRMALQHGTHFLAHDCLRIADDSNLDVPNRRLMVDTRMRLIGKWNRKAYGEKVEVEETMKLVDLTDEELQQVLRQKIKALDAQGIDLKALLGASFASPP